MKRESVMITLLFVTPVMMFGQHDDKRDDSARLQYPMVSQPVLESRFEEMAKVMKSCKYEETPLKAYYSHFLSGDDVFMGPSKTSNYEARCEAVKEEKPVVSCESDDGSITTMIRKSGPYLGTGGFDWHYIWDDRYDGFSLRQMLAEKGSLWIASMSLMLEDDEQNILGNPPIHFHHAREGQYFDPFLPGPSSAAAPMGQVNAWLQIHADETCLQQDGGLACQHYVFPEDYGVEVKQPWGYYALLNDIRPENSPPLPFWFNAILSFYNRPPKYAVGQFQMQPWLNPESNIFGTTPVPQGESVHWVEMHVPSGGRLLNIWVHGHASHGFTGQWTVKASIKQLGLPQPTPQFAVAEVGSHEKFKKQIMSSLALDPSLKFLCQFETALEEPAMKVPYLAGSERQGPATCADGWRDVRKGDVWSLVTFLNTPDEGEFQHAHMQGYIVWDTSSEFYGTSEYWNYICLPMRCFHFSLLKKAPPKLQDSEGLHRPLTSMAIAFAGCAFVALGILRAGRVQTNGAHLL